MNIDGVFEGGGVKGIAFIGAICCLEEKGYNCVRMAGTSAGSIIASLLAVGYSGKELKDIILSLNYKKLLDKGSRSYILPLGKAVALIKDKGIHSGSYLEEWLASLFEAKGKTKFKDVLMNGESKLKIVASDITKREMIILPDDLKKYNIDPMEFEIWKAVRMSISIPFFFKPVKIIYEDNYSFMVDGGLLSNFPVWIFDVKGIPRWPTFGFNLMDSKSNSSKGKTDIISFSADLVDTVVNRNEDIFIRDKDAVRIISIPTLGVRTTEFDITKKKSLELYDSGYKSTQNFLNTWNFRNYIKKYRI